MCSFFYLLRLMIRLFQSQKKTENLECLRTKAGRDKREYDELKAQADVQASAGKGALAKASSFEVQFRIASDNSSV